MSLASATLEDAQENNTTTVENAAVEFCNTYNLLADDARWTAWRTSWPGRSPRPAIR